MAQAAIANFMGAGPRRITASLLLERSAWKLISDSNFVVPVLKGSDPTGPLDLNTGKSGLYAAERIPQHTEGISRKLKPQENGKQKWW